MLGYITDQHSIYDEPIRKYVFIHRNLSSGFSLDVYPTRRMLTRPLVVFVSMLFPPFNIKK